MATMGAGQQPWRGTRKKWVRVYGDPGPPGQPQVKGACCQEAGPCALQQQLSPQDPEEALDRGDSMCTWVTFKFFFKALQGKIF